MKQHGGWVRKKTTGEDVCPYMVGLDVEEGVASVAGHTVVAYTVVAASTVRDDLMKGE